MAQELVIINTDWRLEDAAGRTYGMTYIRVAPPYESMSFKRGFSLHSPTHQRCALFSLILGLEHIDSIPVQSPDSTEFAVSTKHKQVYDVLSGGKVDEWDGKGKWPRAFEHQKMMFLRARDLLREMGPDKVTLLYIERESDDAAAVELYPKEEEKGVDMESVMKTGGKEGIEKAMRDMRMRGVMAQELVMSGARASRATRRKKPA